MGDFSNDAIVFNMTDAPAAPNNGFTGVVDKNLDMATETVTPQTGNTFDEVQSIRRQNPTETFSTEAVMAALKLVDLSGRCIQSNVGGGALGLELYGQRHDPCGPDGRSSSNNHSRRSIADGGIYLQNLTASQESNVRLSLLAHALTNSAGADPITESFAATLVDSANLITDQQFGIYRSLLLGIETEEIISINIEFGVTVVKPSIANGTIWPSKIRILKGRPIVRIRTNNSELASSSSVGRKGVPVTSANTVMRFVQREPDAAFKDVAGSDHFTIAPNGMAYVNSTSASGEQLEESEIMIVTRKSGALKPLVITNDTNLPA